MNEIMNNEEEFLLKWNNHQSNLIGVFKEWLRDESFVDVTLVCGGEAVSGHKVVLAACSPLLNRILHDNPCRHPVVILNDVCSTDMKAILKFIYQGEVSISQSELPSFLRTADNLQIKGLAEGREKEEKKRKEKDDTSGSVKKKRRTEFNKSASTPQSINMSNQELAASSPKSQANLNSNKHSSLNHQQHHSLGVVSSNANETTDTEIIASDINKVSGHLTLKEDDLVLKREPLDYTGEMVWQESNVLIKRENAAQEDLVHTFTNASSSNSHSSNSSYSTTLPYGVLPHLENLGNSSSTPDLLQKNLEPVHSVEEKRVEDDGKPVSIGNEELVQVNAASESDDNDESIECIEEVDDGRIFRLAAEERSAVVASTFVDSVTTTTTTITSDSQHRGGAFPSQAIGSTGGIFSVVAPFASGQNYYNLNSGPLLSCESCSFQSRNPYTFNRHLRIHFGTKEFKCNSCDYASIRKDSLVRHVRVKHLAPDVTLMTGGRTSQCEIPFQQT